MIGHSALTQVLGIQFLSLSLSKALRLIISYVSLVLISSSNMFPLLLFIPCVLQSLLSQDSLRSKCVQVIASYFPIQCLKAFFSLLLCITHIFVGLVIFPADVLHVQISKASNLSLSYFLSVQDSQHDTPNDSLYNLLLQIFAHSILLRRS